MRYTETELDKIVRIGLARIDQIFDKCCDNLDELRPVKKADHSFSFPVGSGLFGLQELGKQRLADIARQQQIILY